MARPNSIDRYSRLMTALATVLVVAVLYLGRDIFVPLALAMLLSFLLSPLVVWLERMKLPRAFAVIVVVTVFLSAVGVSGYIIGRQFVDVINQLPSYEGELHGKLSSLRSHGHFFRKLEKEAKNISAAASSQPATASAQAARDGDSEPERSVHTIDNPMPVQIVQQASPFELLGTYAGSLLPPLATTILVVVFVIFMLYTREDLRDRVIRLVGFGQMNLTTQALDDTGTRISRYLASLAIVNTVYGLILAGGLWIAGRMFGHGTPFPNVLVWGLLVGLLRFIPYIGIFIGAAFPLLLSFAVFSGSGVFLATVGLFLFLEAVVSQFIEPYWYGTSTGLSALAVLVAAVFWTWIWGPAGLLLSTPLTVCVVVLGKYVPALQFLDIMLGDEPVLDDHIRVYQRLIASDEEEAAELIRDSRKDKSLEVIYDKTLMPALGLAEIDFRHGKLDRERLEFIQQAMRDLIEELGDEERERSKAVFAKEQKDEKTEAPRRASLPKDCAVKVMVLPARGVSDEIVGRMLGQLLELRGYCLTYAGAASLTSEMVGQIEKEKPDIVAVSAMPPAAVAHARYLCKRISERFAQTPTIVAVWDTDTDLNRARKRIACRETTPLVNDLESAIQAIDQLAKPALVRASEAAKAG
jgi:predicted PurR-regulated permease PerM/methanogenic corrinoid protein MtbC1